VVRSFSPQLPTRILPAKLDKKTTQGLAANLDGFNAQNKDSKVI